MYSTSVAPWNQPRNLYLKPHFDKDTGLTSAPAKDRENKDFESMIGV